MKRIAAMIGIVVASAGMGLAQSGLYPSAIALVDGQLYHGDDRAGFDLGSGENPARYRFPVKGQNVYCEAIPDCENSIATALSAPASGAKAKKAGAADKKNTQGLRKEQQ